MSHKNIGTHFYGCTMISELHPNQYKEQEAEMSTKTNKKGLLHLCELWL